MASSDSGCARGSRPTGRSIPPGSRAVDAALAAAFVGMFSMAVHAQQPRRVTDGVYTSAQATRGETVYRDRCATCHGATL
jgi:mono/diheme cytochrome c family protein